MAVAGGAAVGPLRVCHGARVGGCEGAGRAAGRGLPRMLGEEGGAGGGGGWVGESAGPSPSALSLSAAPSHPASPVLWGAFSQPGTLAPVTLWASIGQNSQLCDSNTTSRSSGASVRLTPLCLFALL